MSEFTKDADGTIRFDGMTKAEVEAASDAIEGKRFTPPPGATFEQTSQWLVDQNRRDELDDALLEWPSN